MNSFTEMLTLTPSAARMARELIAQNNLDDSYALRLYVAGRTCAGLQYGLALDNNPSQTDQILESEGIKVLIDEISWPYLQGVIVDFIDDERGRGFLINNPNEIPSCNCACGQCE